MITHDERRHGVSWRQRISGLRSRSLADDSLKVRAGKEELSRRVYPPEWKQSARNGHTNSGRQLQRQLIRHRLGSSECAEQDVTSTGPAGRSLRYGSWFGNFQSDQFFLRISLNIHHSGGFGTVDSLVIRVAEREVQGSLVLAEVEQSSLLGFDQESYREGFFRIDLIRSRSLDRGMDCQDLNVHEQRARCGAAGRVVWSTRTCHREQNIHAIAWK